MVGGLERHLKSACELEGVREMRPGGGARSPYTERESTSLRPRGRPPVLGLRAGQTVGGEAMHGTWQVPLWPIP